MARLGHDDYFLEILKLLSLRSTCRRRAVGAIIVDEYHHVLSTGYNGVPRGQFHCIDEKTPCPGVDDPPGDTRRCHAVHAEQNALLQCSRIDLARTLYVSCTPCFQCAKMIANTNITMVVCLEEYKDADGLEVLRRAGISVSVKLT